MSSIAVCYFVRDSNASPFSLTTSSSPASSALVKPTDIDRLPWLKIMAGASSTSSSLSTLFGLFLALLALQLFTWSEVDPFNAKLVAFRQTLLRTHVFIAANDNSIEVG